MSWLPHFGIADETGKGPFLLLLGQRTVSLGIPLM